jgi:hypothetical protein
LGLVLDDTTIKMVDNLREQGKATEAQAILIEELEKRYLGVADTMADSLSGSYERAKIAQEDFNKAIVEASSPIMRLGNELKTNVLGLFTSMPAPMRAATVVFVGATVAVVGIGVAMVALGPIIAALKVKLLSLQAAMGPLGWISLAVAGIAAIGAAVASNLAKAEERAKEALERTRQRTQEFIAGMSALSLQQQRQTLQINLDQTNTQVTQLNRRVQAKVDEIRRLRETADQLRTAGQRIERTNQINAAERELVRLRGELTGATDAKQVLERQLQTIQRDINAERDAALEAQRERDAAAAQALRDELSRLRDKYIRESEEQRILADLARLRTMQASATRDETIRAAQQELDKVRAEIARAEEEARAKAEWDALSPLQQRIRRTQEELAGVKALQDEYIALGLGGTDAERKVGIELGLITELDTSILDQYATKLSPVEKIAADIAKMQEAMGSASADQIPTFELAIQNAQDAMEVAKWEEMADSIQSVMGIIDQLADKVASLFSGWTRDQQAWAERAIKLQERENSRLYDGIELEIKRKREAGELTYELERELLERKQADEDAIARRKNALAKKKFDADKLNTIGAIIMETARAVTSALPNVALSILVGGLGGGQLAQAAAQQYIPQFASGGILYPSGNTGGRLFRGAEFETEYIFRQSQFDKLMGSRGQTVVQNFQINVEGIVGDGRDVALRIDQTIRELQTEGRA